MPSSSCPAFTVQNIQYRSALLLKLFLNMSVVTLNVVFLCTLCCNYTVLSSFGSAYTEPFPMNPTPDGPSMDEDHGRTSEEEEGGVEQSYDRQVSEGIMETKAVNAVP